MYAGQCRDQEKKIWYTIWFHDHFCVYWHVKRIISRSRSWNCVEKENKCLPWNSPLISLFCDKMICDNMESGGSGYFLRYYIFLCLWRKWRRAKSVYWDMCSVQAPAARTWEQTLRAGLWQSSCIMSRVPGVPGDVNRKSSARISRLIWKKSVW